MNKMGMIYIYYKQNAKTHDRLRQMLVKCGTGKGSIILPLPDVYRLRRKRQPKKINK